MAEKLSLGINIGLCLLFVLGAGRHLPTETSLVEHHNEMNHFGNITASDGPAHLERWEMYFVNGDFFGTKARLNVWATPKVESGQVSTTAIWVVSQTPGLPGKTNLVQAGWHVYPERYKDNQPHLFVSWTADEFQSTGCINYDCPGFTQEQPPASIFPGVNLGQTSVRGGQQSYITLAIVKDGTLGDWYLKVGDGDEMETVGRWPRSLFTTLTEHGTQFAWGGAASYPTGGVSPPMGSGEFGKEEEGRAASIKNIQIFRENGGSFSPVVTAIHANSHNDNVCYGTTPVLDNQQDGDMFYYGGPGGCQN